MHIRYPETELRLLQSGLRVAYTTHTGTDSELEITGEVAVSGLAAEPHPTVP